MRNWTLACDPISATVKHPSQKEIMKFLQFKLNNLNSIGSLPSCFSITAPCPQICNFAFYLPGSKSDQQYVLSGQVFLQPNPIPVTTLAEKKPVLTPSWNCFFDLLFIAFIIIIQNVLPQRILTLCLTAKLKHLCSEPWQPVDDKKEKINTSAVRGLPFQEMFARLMAFLHCFLTRPHL